MTTVLVAEPDDDFCLFLQLAIFSAGCRTIITGSFADAREALRNDVIDTVIIRAKLPGGSGLLLAREALQSGKPTYILRGNGRSIEIADHHGTLFRSDRLGVCEFLKKVIRRPSAVKTRRTDAAAER